MSGVLAFLAHPDDEFFCAGLLAALSSRGVPVHLAYWTRGEGGLSPKRRLVWRCFPRFLHPRVGEARRSAAVLGASSLDFIGSVDPAPSQGMKAPADDARVLKEKLGRLIRAYGPEMVVTHGSDGDYGHPAHVELHRVVRELATESDCPCLSFNASWPGAPDAFFLNRSDPADYLFDSRPFLGKKLAVVRAHRSQRMAFVAMAQRQGGRVRQLIKISRWEGYRCWSVGEARSLALRKLQQWAGGEISEVGAG